MKLAIIANALTPYRVHYHQRIAREMPEIQLSTVCTHEGMDQAWQYAPPPEINAIQFGPGESVTRQSEMKRSWHEWNKGGKIIDWIERERVGAVLVNGYNDAGRIRILRWCRKHGVPTLMFGDSNIRGDRAGGLKSIIKRMRTSRILRWCDAVLACGTLGREYFLKYGVSPERIFFTPYEPDYEAIEKLDLQAIESVAQKFGLSKDRRRIIFSGRMVALKRPELAIDAFAALAEQRPNWDLVMVGGGPMQQELMARVPQALTKRVFFTRFIGDQVTVSALYRLCDVLVLPSDYEPWALVINEALAAGLAVVCTDVVGAAAELVRNGINGFTFPPGDLAAMTARLRELTAEDRIEQFKSASRGVLADWRQRADPVEGLRRALAACVR